MRSHHPGLLLAACLAASPAAAAEEAPAYEMTTYQLVLLNRAEGRPGPGEAEASRLQEEHLALLEGLVRDGVAVMVGPVMDAAPLRGVVVLDAGSVEKAEELMGRDPWIQAGHLTAEVHPWWAAKGILQRPPVFMDHEPVWLGFLRRPAGAPEFTKERLAELQAGHMANLEAMADSGALVIAGPMGDDTPLRGILVFRDAGRAEIEAMVARDPAIQARRLEVELRRWMLPKGTLPPP